MKPSENPWFTLFGGTFVLSNKLQAVGDRLVEGLSTKQWFLLRNIIDLPRDPPPTVSRIAKEMDSTRQNVTKMLAVLERGGSVTVEPSAGDRRSLAVRLTEKGKEQLRQAPANAEDFFQRLYRGITPEDRDTAVKVLLQLVGNLQEMQDAEQK